VGKSFSVIPVPEPPIIRKGASGSFYDKGLEGASHHAVIPNVNTVDELREIWPRLSIDEKKLFDVIARAYLAAIMPDFRYRQTNATLDVRGFAHEPQRAQRVIVEMPAAPDIPYPEGNMIQHVPPAASRLDARRHASLDLRQQAIEILRANDRGGYIVPTATGLYPAQWNWDSCLVALGLAQFDEPRAVVEIETLFGGQWPDGMVPGDPVAAGRAVSAGRHPACGLALPDLEPVARSLSAGICHSSLVIG
jgi:hypothetical protein